MRSRKYSSTLSDNTARLLPCSKPVVRALQNDIYHNKNWPQIGMFDVARGSSISSPPIFSVVHFRGGVSSPLQRCMVAPMHAPRTASNSMSRRIGPPGFLGPPTIAPMPMGRKHGRMSSPPTCPRFPPLAPLKARCEPWLVCGLESRRPCASLLPSTLHTHNRRARGRPRL